MVFRIPASTCPSVPPVLLLLHGIKQAHHLCGDGKRWEGLTGVGAFGVARGSADVGDSAVQCTEVELAHLLLNFHGISKGEEAGVQGHASAAGVHIHEGGKYVAATVAVQCYALVISWGIPKVKNDDQERRCWRVHCWQLWETRQWVVNASASGF